MKTILNRTFTFSVPSNLTLNWLFEFHCTLNIYADNKVFISVTDANIGSVELITYHPGDMTRLFLYVWHQCSMLALNFVVAQTDRDAIASQLSHSRKQEGLP